MTTTHPENSQTNTWEWTDDTILKQDNADSGHRLLAGDSGDGGASCVDDGDAVGVDSFGGFRLSVVLRKP
jgi:hypothetical protein